MAAGTPGSALHRRARDATAQVKLALKRRAHVLRNTVRTQRLLDLMTLLLRGADQTDAYADRISAHLEAHHVTRRRRAPASP